MSGFAIGEVAEIHGLVRHTQFNGMHCIITGGPHSDFYPIDIPGFEQWIFAHKRNLRKRRPPASDDTEYRQAMLDCIERAKWPVEVTG